MILFKPSVRIKRWTPALRKLICTLDYLSDLYKKDITVTSVNDSGHSVNSRHYTDEAIDIRSRDMDNELKYKFLDDYRRLLNHSPEPLFTVLLENEGRFTGDAVEHFHAQVKKGEEVCLVKFGQ